MPCKDERGPSGKGPRTGRGLGNCSSESGENSQADSMSAGMGAGQGGNPRGGGRGRCFGGGRGRGGRQFRGSGCGEETQEQELPTSDNKSE
jgi:hypothetical protein